jgi:hypothetical protein
MDGADSLAQGLAVHAELDGFSGSRHVVVARSNMPAISELLRACKGAIYGARVIEKFLTFARKARGLAV